MGRIEKVVKRTGAVVPFNKQRISNAIYRAAVAVGGRDLALAERLADRVVEHLDAVTPPDHIPTVEEIQDVVEEVLIKTGHAKTAKAYILYRQERARRRQERARRSLYPSGNIPWRKIWEALDWAVDHDLHTVESLNARIEGGEFPQIVRESERAYIEDVCCAAEMIKEREGEVRLVIVAGPSSSGKTTTTIKLEHLLRKMGLRLVPLSVDNYFFDLGLHPRDEHGDYDYETPQALDLELINEHLQRLIAGEEVRIPYYDFETGRQHQGHTPLQLDPDQVILIDSLHGLYPDMTEDIDDEHKFKLYIEPLLQMKGPNDRYIRWTDLRLMRRMERDVVCRNYCRRRTLEHWHYVRSSEMRNIIPYLHTADYVVNSGLPYEVPIMRPRLLDAFRGWEQEYAHDPLRQDAATRAERVRRLLEAVVPVEDDSAIPPDSLLREFIGGSCYDY
ncbi:MAG: ATP cone domain-containing protein [Chloroflexota bacterium]|nr:ATP cone domain-containing protein [Chloroflexota bacterium]